MTVLLLCALPVKAQPGDALVRVLDVKRSTMQQEITRLADAGFDIALARLDPGLVIAQRGPEPGPRAYLFVEDLQTFLTGKRLERGYRLLPQSLSPGGKPYCAVFEKRDNDDQLREYAFVMGSSTGDLEKKARTGRVDGRDCAADLTADAGGFAGRERTVHRQERIQRRAAQQFHPEPDPALVVVGAPTSGEQALPSRRRLPIGWAAPPARTPWVDINDCAAGGARDPGRNGRPQMSKMAIMAI